MGKQKNSVMLDNNITSSVKAPYCNDSKPHTISKLTQLLNFQGQTYLQEIFEVLNIYLSLLYRIDTIALGSKWKSSYSHIFISLQQRNPKFNQISISTNSSLVCTTYYTLTPHCPDCRHVPTLHNYILGAPPPGLVQVC